MTSGLGFFVVARQQSHGAEFLSFADLWTHDVRVARLFAERRVAERTRERVGADAVLP